MKNRLLTISLLLLAAMGVLFASCKKEYPQPPIQDLPIGTVYTIDSLVKMGTHDFKNEDASVYGIVTADEQSGNLYKCAFMQDRATGAAIELYLKAPSGVRIGDSIRVYLRDVTLALYNGLPQLSNFEADGHIIILANNKPIEPALTSISEIKTGKFLAGLVRLENVWFTEQATFADPTTYGNRFLVDEENPFVNEEINKKFVVRTSNYANFAYDPLPSDTGNLVAIASIYNNTWQLIIRSRSEVDFHNFTPGGGGQGVVPGEVQSLPYSQSFYSEFGTYMTYDVSGNQFWEIDYHTAKMTGYAGNTYNANEDWLISSPVAITGVNDAKMTMSYIGRYFNNINEEVTIWASTDYTWGSDPTTANWRYVPANLTEASNWSDFLTAEIPLTDYVGETVTFAVKYISTDSKAGTMEIQSVTIEEGSGVTPPEPPTPGQGEGSGTADDPYNVAAGIGLQDQGVTAWVQGYIVGAVKSGPSSVSSNDDISWAAPFTRATNVLIADDPTCNEVSNCIIIELGATTLKSQVNLVDNPGNLGKHLTVLGTFRKYFGQSGLRDCPGTENDFVLEGGDTPTPPDPGTTEYFNQTLTTQASFNTFSSYSVTGEQEWYFNTAHPDYGAVMSGYDNTPFANEDWFISPVFDLSGSTSPILNFEHARGPQDSMNVGVEEGYYTVWVTNDYTDGEDPNQERWVELPILNQPTVKWQFVSAGDLVIPAEFKTATCRIAFRYLSIDGASATWEVKNVVVKEQ